MDLTWVATGPPNPQAASVAEASQGSSASDTGVALTLTPRLGNGRGRGSRTPYGSNAASTMGRARN